ncbi:MAG TPA: thioesterase family protein [Burkholderiaceae bacterium]|nr:thioesterase family protein [Burkholderiaceae bacterium]
MNLFRIEVPLRWGDMDAMGHVNNVVYFRLMEEARIQWFETLGFATMPVEQAPILAHVSCDFVKPLNYPGTAVVTQKVERLGNASAEISIRIERTDEPGVVYARGRSVVVWYDYSANKSIPWPDSVREALA